MQDSDNVDFYANLLHKSGAHQFLKFRFQVVILVLKVLTIQQEIIRHCCLCQQMVVLAQTTCPWWRHSNSCSTIESCRDSTPIDISISHLQSTNSSKKINKTTSEGITWAKIKLPHNKETTVWPLNSWLCVHTKIYKLINLYTPLFGPACAGNQLSACDQIPVFPLLMQHRHQSVSANKLVKHGYTQRSQDIWVYTNLQYETHLHQHCQ